MPSSSASSSRVGEAGRRLHTGRPQRAGGRRPLVCVSSGACRPFSGPSRTPFAASSISPIAPAARDAVVHASTRAARPRRALPAVALRGAAPRLRSPDLVLDEADELPLGSGASPARATRSTSRPRGGARLQPDRAQQHRRQRRPRFRRLVPARRVARHDSPERIAEDFILFTSEEFGFFEPRRRRDGQQPDAAEKESRSARARARKERSRDRTADGLAGDDEGLRRVTTRTCRRTRKRCSTPKTRGLAVYAR